MRILYLSMQGYKPPTISRILEEEGMKASRRGIAYFLKRYTETGTIARLPGSGRPSVVTEEIKAIVEQQMRDDDETTAHQLHSLLNNKGYGLSIRTVLRCRSALGWTFHGSSYCQLIREDNKRKRLEWARKFQGEADEGFKDVIWTDETTVQLETHRRFCCRKQGERPKNKPRSVCIQACIACVVCRHAQILCMHYHYSRTSLVQSNFSVVHSQRVLNYVISLCMHSQKLGESNVRSSITSISLPG